MKKHILLLVAASFIDIGRTLDRDHDGLSIEVAVKRRADAPDPIQLTHTADGWFVDVTVGTAGQLLRLEIDTISPVTWVPSSDAEHCHEAGCNYGSFDTSLSTTFERLPGDGTWGYRDVQGTVFADDFSFGPFSLKDWTLGLGENISDYSHGILGLALNKDGGSSSWSNLWDSLISDGLVNTEAFSLWLNDEDAPGSLQLGAIDTAKYEGELDSLMAYNGSVDGFPWLCISSVSANSSSGSDTMGSTESVPILGIVTTGFREIYLPVDIAYDMWAVAGARFQFNISGPIIPCAKKNSSGVFTFGLGGPDGPQIKIPMRQLVSLDPVFYGAADDDFSSEDMCEFLVKNETDPKNFVIGEAFLLSTYAVFDLFNKKLGIAQARHDNASSHIVPFEVHGAQIPSAVLVSNQPTAVPPSSITPPVPIPTKSYAAAAGFKILTTPTIPAAPTATEAQTTAAQSNGLSTGGKVGVGVGVPVGSIAVGLLLFFLWKKFGQAIGRREDGGTYDIAGQNQPVSHQELEKQPEVPEAPGDPVPTYELSPDEHSVEVSSIRFSHREEMPSPPLSNRAFSGSTLSPPPEGRPFSELSAEDVQRPRN
ncbi:aspartic peptidase domain-containing protein [Xylariaceae sp. FL0662B]|nr:aspartic peptidase domain-containing protein [Xylariaceae sp. FL0662B]